MPEFIDQVVVITSPKCSFSVIENERFLVGLVFVKTGSTNTDSGTEGFDLEVTETGGWETRDRGLETEEERTGTRE